MYNEIPIRECNFITLRVGAVPYKRLIIECERTGLPISKILAHSSRPCNSCTNIDVLVYEKGKEIKVTRGIFSQNISQSSGTSIIKQKKNAKK